MKTRFYRSNLENTVWDSESGKPLAEFVDAQFMTDDPVVIKKLRAMGYPEVDLDAESPPPIPEVFQPAESPDMPILPKGMTEEQVLKRQQMLAARTASQRKTGSSETAIPTPKKEKPEAKAKPSAKEPAAKKRPIKRRSSAKKE